MYTENEMINVVNNTIKMFDNLSNQIELIKSTYIKKVEDLIEAKRQEEQAKSESKEEKVEAEDTQPVKEESKKKNK